MSVPVKKNDPLSRSAMGAYGLGLVSHQFGHVGLATLAMPIFLKERNYTFVSKQAKQPFLPAAKDAFRNKPFLLVVGIIMTLIVGTQTAGALAYYINAYYLYDGNKLAAGALLGVAQLVSAASWFLFIPSLPYLSLIPVTLMGLGGNAFWILINSMKADICDWDELKSRKHREGIYGALGNWMQKVATSFTYLISGLILQRTGFDAAAQGHQTSAAILGIRIGYAGLPVLFPLPCLWLLAKYPINQKIAREMQSTLKARRGN